MWRENSVYRCANEVDVRHVCVYARVCMMCVCACVCLYAYVYVYACMHVCVCVACACMHACACECVRTHTCKENTKER